MQNKKQIEFVKSIHKAAGKASDAYLLIQKAYQLTGTTSEASESYLYALQTFMNACNRMLLEVDIHFGEGVSDINLKRAANEGLKPYTLN